MLNFSGTQSFSGSGTVVFNNVAGNALRAVASGMTLTIGAGITLRGGSNQSYGGNIGYSSAYGGNTNFTIVNQGTISADLAGTSLTVSNKRLQQPGDAADSKRRQPDGHGADGQLEHGCSERFGESVDFGSAGWVNNLWADRDRRPDADAQRHVEQYLHH